MTMESPIDEKYRLLLLEHYLEDAQHIPFYNGYPKWRFRCPFCGSISSKEYKKKERKGSLLWDVRQNSWIFYCSRKESSECMNSKNLFYFLRALNPPLAEAYRRERYHSGTVGKGRNCKSPRSVAGISTASNNNQD